MSTIRQINMRVINFNVKVEKRGLTAGRRIEFSLRYALRADSVASIAFYTVTIGFKVPAD
jgi:hypothetical protein